MFGLINYGTLVNVAGPLRAPAARCDAVTAGTHGIAVADADPLADTCADPQAQPNPEPDEVQEASLTGPAPRPGVSRG